MLSIECLDERVMPTGLITASLSPSGLLSLVGDDLDNVLTKITVTGANVVLTPDGATGINSANPGDPVTLPGSVKSIKADFHGGSDAIAIDPAADFVMSGTASITLGDGNNSLDMVTTQKIALKGLTVKGGDGIDLVTIQGGAGKGSLIGATSMSYANGGSTTVLSNLTFTSGVSLTATDAVAISNGVTATNIAVAKTFSASLGTSTAALASFDNCTLGGLKESGYIIGALLQPNTTVNGNVSLKGGFQADLQVDKATITGNASITAPNASMEATGGGTTINGNLSLTGAAYTQASFASTSLTQVKGNITAKGGWFSDTFETNGFFKAGKNLSLTLGGGDNIVTLGDGTAPIAIAGNLSIKGGAGVDTFTLDRVALAGTASFFAYGGADLLSIEDGSTFAKTFSADMSTGDDTISIALTVGAPGPVTFAGTAKIQAGVGNDFLLLGVDAGSGGDANSKAVFNGAGSFIDGGVGFDTFDPSSAQFSGLTPASW